MNKLIKNVEQWATDKGLEKSDPFKQLAKVIEELGEVGGGMARADKAEIMDGIGDTVVTLIILAMQHDMSLEECLACAYDEIKDRKGKMVNGVFVKESDLT